MQLMQTDLIEI